MAASSPTALAPALDAVELCGVRARQSVHAAIFSRSVPIHLPHEPADVLHLPASRFAPGMRCASSTASCRSSGRPTSRSWSGLRATRRSPSAEARASAS